MKFPTYQSQRNISTNIVKTQSSSLNFQPLISAGSEVAKQWQNSKNIAETNQAYNNMEQGTYDILQKAQQDTDYNNSQKYLDEIKQLKDNQYKVFSTETQALKFQRVADSSANQATIKIESMFRDKFIKNQQGEVIRSQELSKQSYMGGDLKSKEINTGILKENYEAGFISDSMYKKGLNDMDNWENERAQQDMAINPEFVLNNIDNYKLDEVQKSDIRKDAESLVKKNNELKAVEMLQLQDLSSSELINIVNSDASDVEKSQALQSQVLLGNVSSEFANKLNKLMVSSKSVNAVTNDDVMADIVLRSYDLNSLSTIDPQSYLKGVQNIKDEIVSRQIKGELTQEDVIKLNNTISNLSNKNTAESTSMIAYNFGQVKDTFDVQLPPEYRGKAMRDLYYAVDGKEMTDTEYSKVALKVVDSINKERRGVALRRTQEPDTINNDFLAKNNITMEQVQAQAKKSNMTNAQVIQLLRQKIGE